MFLPRLLPAHRLFDHERWFILSPGNLCSVLLYFALRSDGQLRCGDVRSFLDATDRR
jgi:hypothetical protein